MSLHHSVWVLGLQTGNQRLQRSELLWGEVVLWGLPISGHTTNHADSDRVRVVILNMGTNLVFLAPLFDGAVATDNVVITNCLPALSTMPAVNVSSANVSLGLRCRAMHHNEVGACTSAGSTFVCHYDFSLSHASGISRWA